jgi:chemotaxis protein MotB
VLIEDPHRWWCCSASGPIADNWDLSTKEHFNCWVFLGKTKKINKQNQHCWKNFLPLRSNATAEGKSKKIVESKLS